jgi:hypothetical protein
MTTHAVERSRPTHDAVPGPGLRIGAVEDAAEQEADRVATMVMTDLSRVAVSVAGSRSDGFSVVRRQPAPGSAAWRVATEDARAHAFADKMRGELIDAALAEAMRREPLKSILAEGRRFVSTPEGMATLAAVVVTTITGLVLTKTELPEVSRRFDLGNFSEHLEGLAITPTWKGRLDNPTSASVRIEFAPKRSPLALTQTLGADSKTGLSVEEAVAFRPGGRLSGTSVTAGFKATDTPFRPAPGPRTQGANLEASAGLDWKPQSGRARGTALSAKGTLDNAGGASVMFTITVPLDSILSRRPADEGPLRRSPDGPAAPGADAGHAPPSVSAVLAEPGMPLPEGPRAAMSRAFGVDFSGVRVHTGAAAASSARDVGAAAFTLGNHIVFGPDRFGTTSRSGLRLLAHELAHVVQQGAAPAPTVRRQPADALPADAPLRTEVPPALRALDALARSRDRRSVPVPEGMTGSHASAIEATLEEATNLARLAGHQLHLEIAPAVKSTTIIYTNDGSGFPNVGGGSDQGLTASVHIRVNYDNDGIGWTSAGLNFEIWTPVKGGPPVPLPGYAPGVYPGGQGRDSGGFKAPGYADFEYRVSRNGPGELLLLSQLGANSTVAGDWAQSDLVHKPGNLPLHRWTHEPLEPFAAFGVKARTLLDLVEDTSLDQARLRLRLTLTGQGSVGTHGSEAGGAAMLTVRSCYVRLLGTGGALEVRVGADGRGLARYNDQRPERVGAEVALTSEVLVHLGPVSVSMGARSLQSTLPEDRPPPGEDRAGWAGAWLGPGSKTQGWLTLSLPLDVLGLAGLTSGPGYW